MRAPRSRLPLFLLAGLIGPVAAEAKSWTSIGPFGNGGRVLSLAIDPRSASTVYAGNAGAAGGRLFKTTDAGATWQPLEEGLPPAPVLTIAIDPFNPETVYVGLEANSSPGLFQSEDAGRTWKPAAEGLPARRINALVMDPTTSGVLYASGVGATVAVSGAYKSIDAGRTWRRISNGLGPFAPTCLAIDPQNPRTIYAGVPFEGVFKSTDAGENWAPSNGGYRMTIDALAVDPTNPATVYAAAGGVWKSTDGGGSWTLQNRGFPEYAAIRVLAIHPSIPKTLFAAGRGLFKSSDGGTNWTEKDAGFSPFSENVTSIAIATTPPGFIYTGTQSYFGPVGVVRSSDSGETWRPANAGLLTHQVRKVAVSPATPPVIYAATEQAGLFRTTDSGGSWFPANVGLTDPNILDLAVDPVSPQTVYAATYGRGIFKTVNGGANWVPANTGLPSGFSLQTLAIDPVSPATIYASGYGVGVFKSVDGAVSWQLISNEWIHKIAIDPSSPATLYGAGERSALLKSLDSGKTWTTILEYHCVSVGSIVIDPRNVSNLFLVLSYACPIPCCFSPPGRVFRSKDAGASWIDVTPGPIVRQGSDLAVIPGTPSVIYLSTGTSVYRSLDEGTSWVRHGDELPYTLSLALDRNNPPQALYVGTLGASVMKASVSSGFHTTVPCRVIDTRQPVGSYGGPALASGAERRFLIAGLCGVPTTARAISFNLTVAGPAHAGTLRAYPAGSNVPTASVVSYAPGRTRSNSAIVSLSLDGEIAVQSVGSVHFIADINGYFE